MPMLFCQDCGEKIPENAVFCPKCGFRFEKCGSAPPPFTLTKSKPLPKETEQDKPEPEKVTLEKKPDPVKVTLEKKPEPEKVTLEKKSEPAQTAKTDRPFSLQPASEKRETPTPAPTYTPPKPEPRPAFSYTPPQNDSSYSAPMTYDRSVPQRAKLPAADVVTIKKTSKAPTVIIILILVLLLAGAGAFVYFYFFHNKSNDDKGTDTKIGFVDIKPQWTKTGLVYTNEITSDRTDTFAALVMWKPGNYMSTYTESVQLVYMENGKGTVTDTESALYDEAPSQPETVGCAVGEKAADGFVSSCKTIHVVTEAGHTVKLEIKTGSNETGVLFCDIKNASGSVILNDQPLVIINGESAISIENASAYSISDGDELALEPEYFVSAEAVESSEYNQKYRTVANKYSTRYYAWEINESYEFKTAVNGIMLYKTDVIKGEPLESDTVPSYDYKRIQDGKTTLNSVFRFDNSAADPEFSITMPAYIPLTPVSSDGTASTQPSTTEDYSVIDSGEELDLRGLCYECTHYNYSYTTLAPDDSYVIVDTNPQDIDGHTDTAALDFIAELNKKLGFRDDLINEMKATRSAVNGKTEENDRITLKWSYFPDTGLEVKYTKK